MYRRLFNLKFLLFLGLFFISGFTGLIYEVIWERVFEIYFGVNTLSVTLIVSAYMLGLGLGSLYGGRLTQKYKNHLFLYGILEGGIAIAGFFSPTYLVWLGTKTAGSPMAIVFLLSFTSLLIPTMLMGATLPILSQAFIKNENSSGTIISILYGINTLGAAFGAIISGFALIGEFGLDGTVYIGVTLNAAISLLAVFASQKKFNSEIDIKTKQEEILEIAQPETRWGYRQTVLSAFLIGFIDLAYQMIWFRILLITNNSSAYTFPTLLFVFLLGLALGGFLLGKTVDKQKNRVLYFVILQLFIALFVVSSIISFYVLLESPNKIIFIKDLIYGEIKWPLSPFIFIEGTGFVLSKTVAIQSFLRFLIIPVVLIFPASFLMGGGVPILDRIAINNVQTAGKKIGDIYVSNILGSVFGTLAVPFIFFKFIGTEQTLKILVIFSLIFPILYLLYRPINQKKNIFQNNLLVLLSVLVLLPVIFVPNGNWLYSKIISIGMGVPAAISEWQDGVISLTNGNPNYLLINGEAHSFFPSGMTYEGDAILCTGASKPKTALVIGFGGGHTASALTQTPNIEKITVVELLSNLHTFLEPRFSFVRGTINNPKVHYVIDDGRRFLYANPTSRYDLIIIDPQWTSAAGSNNLYSADALHLYQKHLTEKGILCAWTNENTIMPSTFASIFPNVDQIGMEIIAKNSPIRYDYLAMLKHQEKFISSPYKNVEENPQLFLDPAWILASYAWDQEDIWNAKNETPIINDFNPLLEYYFLFQANPIRLNSGKVSSLENILGRVDNCTEECRNKIILAYNFKNSKSFPFEKIMKTCLVKPNQEDQISKNILYYFPLQDGKWWVINQEWELLLVEPGHGINCN